MSLHKHVDANEVLKKARGGRGNAKQASSATTLATPYSARYEAFEDIPKYKMPAEGIAANAAYQMIHDELDFDGRPNLNLASFVHTYMEPEADKLIMENISKNMSDEDEYPAMVDIHARCISMLADLWGAKGGDAIGTATTGSSEAIMLGGLAMKRRWQERQMAAGKDYSKPNVIMGSNAQVAIEKFARYFEVENRLIPVCAESRHCLDVSKIKENLDENTIGVFVILGSTYTGHYEPVQEVSDLLDEYEKETGLDIPIHVDGASGAMVAPFVHPSTKWDFELPRVKSINSFSFKDMDWRATLLRRRLYLYDAYSVARGVSSGLFSRMSGIRLSSSFALVLMRNGSSSSSVSLCPSKAFKVGMASLHSFWAALHVRYR